MDSRNYGVHLFCMLTLFNCGALLFLYGFFPDAYNTVNLDSDVKRPMVVDGLSLQPSQRQHDQIILMIIDALRYDFMNKSENTPFAHSKRCDLLTLQVANPTVTMPRIKSLMTGKLSNFIDIIRNLGESDIMTDSLIHVLNKHGAMINFAGDGTWKKIFPKQFTRKKVNLDSFYVQDFYEGDIEVKKTLKQEIKQTDWSLLILHFLGLDHIGHVEGSNSVKIPVKLLEMDEVIRDIYENPLFKNRLLLVTGDHGMRNGGGHGGSTHEEITVPLVVFMENCNRNEPSKKQYNQIDLTPTLAILFSVEIPKTSIGCLIPELLPNLTYEETLYAFYYNAQHLLTKAIAKFGITDVEVADYTSWYENATRAHKQFLEARMQNSTSGFNYEQALANYKRIANSISSRIAKSLITFDNTLISIGIFLTSIVTTYTLVYTLFADSRYIAKPTKFNKKQAILSLFLAIVIVILTTHQPTDYIVKDTTKKSCFFVVFIAVAIYITLSILKALQKILLPLEYTRSIRLIWCFPIPLTMCYILTIVLLISSSYIEYEQLSSHYLGCSCLLLLIIRTILQRIRTDLNKKGYVVALCKMKSELIGSVLLLLAVRLFRSLEIYDNLKWLKTLKDGIITLCFLLGLLLLAVQLSKLTTIRQMIPCTLGIFSVLCYRVIEEHIPFIAVFKASSFYVLLVFWFCVITVMSVEFKSYLKSNGIVQFLKTYIVCILLLASLLHKPRNVILLPSMLLILDKIYTICDNLELKIPEPYKKTHVLAYKALMTIFIANMFFFYQGNSNSLATIDLNPAYVGQKTYNPVIAVIFVTINTYSAPILAFYFLILHILKKNFSGGANTHSTSLLVSSSGDALRYVLTLYTTATLLPSAIYLCYMIKFRYHLFIYSVFAPKFFYECYNVIVFYTFYGIIFLFLTLFRKM